MKIYKDVASCPEITEEQRYNLIARVRAGRFPWSSALMARAKITPEECATPQTIFPMNVIEHLIEMGCVVNTNTFHPKLIPSEIYFLQLYGLGINKGIPSEDLLEFYRYDREFKEKLIEIDERCVNGAPLPKVTEEDLRPLLDEEEG